VKHDFVMTCSEKTDDSDDEEAELRRVSGPRFGTAGGHLHRDVVIACTPSCIAHAHNACSFTEKTTLVYTAEYNATTICTPSYSSGIALQ